MGAKRGKNYSLNFPLGVGMDDASYESIYKPVIGKIMQVYQPGAIVLQCGADSLCGDRLGCFNLSIKGHADCVKFTLAQKVPTLILGGGGYTIRNVARCWAYETSVLLDTPIGEEIPYNDYFEYYAPDFKLHLTKNPNLENANTPESLATVRDELLDMLGALKGAPSLQIHDVPPDWNRKIREVDDDKQDPDARPPNLDLKTGAIKREHPSEFTDEPPTKKIGRAHV